jgi:N-acetylneuraminic acid mutarotase
VLGGGNNERTLALHSAYDPLTDRWTELAPLPRSKGSVAAVVFGGRIYAIGGRSGSSDFGDVNVYDARRDRWAAAAPISPRGTAGAVAYNGWIYVVGGESQRTAATLRSMLRWKPGLKAWQRVVPMPSARSFARAVVFRDRVYVVGGSRFFGDSHAAEGSRIVETYRRS